jgi:hypothetical protein
MYRSRALLAPIVVLQFVGAGALAAQAPGESRSDSTTHERQAPAQARPASRPWYDRLSLRGYAQIRYNRLFESNARLTCAQCDRSIGNNGGIFLRRGRLVVSGDVSNRVSVYIQPDFGSDAAGAQHYLQLRDAYFDLWLDGAKEHRLRFGQSKVPFGFENLQSSSNRLPLDRSDPLNSAVPNERDFGLLYQWATSAARRNFRILTDSGLKGTGDYGIFAFGVVNGQTANRAEANNSLHTFARVSYPFRLASGQFVEVGVSGYTGRFVVPTRTTGVGADPEYDDRRMALSFTWYAQPLGLVGEWNWGEGPEYVAATNRIESRHLHGGFVQAMYRWQAHGQTIQPFARAQFYTGGKKLEQDARHHEVHEYEGGVEWLPVPAFELTAEYARSDRLVMDGTLTSPNRQKGGFLRLQAQFNY